MAGTVTYEKNTINTGSSIVEEHVWDWTADAADGTVPATATDEAVSGFVLLGVTNPGATAPTANYDITVTDADGVDVFGGTLADRSATASEQTRPGLATAADYGERVVGSVLTFGITDGSNLVNSAVGVLKVYVRR